MAGRKGELVQVECKTCGKSFSVYYCRYKVGRGIFCSKQCKHNYTPKQKLVKCDYCSKKFMAKESELKRKKHKYCSRECAAKDYKNKYGGSKSFNWKGGKQREKHNGSYKYSNWRLKVYERDEFTCRECGQKGGKLNAHHQFSWTKFPSLRYELWNGITLCVNCHKKEHSKKQEGKNEYSKKG